MFHFTLLPGDYNRDNIVDAADYTVWRDNYGITAGALFTQGDGEGDGDVDDVDGTIWVNNFGVSHGTW